MLIELQAAEARSVADKAMVRNEASGTATSETTETTLNRKTSNINFSVGVSGSYFYNPAPPKIDNRDNTIVKRPINLPIQR